MAIVRRLALVPVFFALRVLCGLALLKLSASFLPVSGFAVFSQFMLFAALLNLIAVGGAQNGIVRQAAAAADQDALQQVHGAALLIWAAAAPVLALAIAAGSGLISQVLAGTTDRWPMVIVIGGLALLSGPGQIWCSLLSGRHHVASSLSAQAFGLVLSTLTAGFLITRHEPALAAAAFAAGGLATMAAAFVLAMRAGIRPTARRAALEHVTALLRYSAALAATTGFSSITLFALRAVYRDGFGHDQLGYWLAANRISDMSTQLLGLFMIQFFVPHLAMTRSEGEQRSLIFRCWAAGAGVMSAVLVVFSLGARPLVHAFLSDAYLPAIPVIRAYMVGDLMRVWPSLAMYAAFAAGRPGRYAGIEIAVLTLMGVIAVSLMRFGVKEAPQFAYAGAYATAAVLTTAFFLHRRSLRLQPA